MIIRRRNFKEICDGCNKRRKCVLRKAAIKNGSKAIIDCDEKNVPTRGLAGK